MNYSVFSNFKFSKGKKHTSTVCEIQTAQSRNPKNILSLYPHINQTVLEHKNGGYEIIDNRHMINYFPHPNVTICLAIPTALCERCIGGVR